MGEITLLPWAHFLTIQEHNNLIEYLKKIPNNKNPIGLQIIPENLHFLKITANLIINGELPNNKIVSSKTKKDFFNILLQLELPQLAALEIIMLCLKKGLQIIPIEDQKTLFLSEENIGEDQEAILTNLFESDPKREKKFVENIEEMLNKIKGNVYIIIGGTHIESVKQLLQQKGHKVIVEENILSKKMKEFIKFANLLREYKKNKYPDKYLKREIKDIQARMKKIKPTFTEENLTKGIIKFLNYLHETSHHSLKDTIHVYRKNFRRHGIPK